MRYVHTAVLNRIAEIITKQDPRYSKLGDVFKQVAKELEEYKGDARKKFKLPDGH